MSAPRPHRSLSRPGFPRTDPDRKPHRGFLPLGQPSQGSSPFRTKKWNQSIREGAESEDGAEDPLIGASAEPSKRPRTRLTDEEVDAMRPPANGANVTAVATRFGVHRGTIWVKTRMT